MVAVRSFVEEVVPSLYEDDRTRSGAHPNSDMSHNNRCHVMSLVLFDILQLNGFVCRRELHKLDGAWHYVVAHAAPEAEPTQQDIITDLNPWQFEPTTMHTGHLHDERTNVQIALAEAGAPEWFVGLRGIASIAETHTVVPVAQGLLL